MKKCLRTVSRLRGNIALFGVVALLAVLTVRHAETTGPKKDVQISVQRGDTRLFVVISGSEQVVLGIPTVQQDDAKTRCGIRSLKLTNLTNLTNNAASRELSTEASQLQRYAGEYNQLMLSHCTKNAIGKG
ncbi:hypothetical protein [Aeromonas caviae]|jgi:hypothetical protein|uniref:hypothetical protein n=1 Tax=Aeromonas caviae TaxID=648 RepID=UPI0029D842DC|nr:hypothetical protein [Aeromonas caviae]MDX7700393.1 hypothetical protein [Aeromonas caviae]MDX7863612.1 hypothetical protein [Aeromonas caviae]